MAIPAKTTKIGSIRLSLKSGSIQGQMYFLITIRLLSCRPNFSLRHKYLWESLKQVKVNFHILCLAVDLHMNLLSKKAQSEVRRKKKADNENLINLHDLWNKHQDFWRPICEKPPHLLLDKTSNIVILRRPNAKHNKLYSKTRPSNCRVNKCSVPNDQDSYWKRGLFYRRILALKLQSHKRPANSVRSSSKG